MDSRKLMDASNLMAPRPAWRWLVLFCPTFDAPPVGEKCEYVVGGTDDRAEAEAMCSGRRYFEVRENPVWRHLN